MTVLSQVHWWKRMMLLPSQQVQLMARSGVQHFDCLQCCLAHDIKPLISIINPLSPNSDQHQISPYSTPEVMRIKDLITLLPVTKNVEKMQRFVPIYIPRITAPSLSEVQTLIVIQYRFAKFDDFGKGQSVN